MEETQKNILNLEKELNLKSPHRLNEINVEISCLLAELSDGVSELEEEYENLKAEIYAELRSGGVKHNPAKETTNASARVVYRRAKIARYKEFIRTRESTIRRAENYLKNLGDFERRGV